MSLLEAEIQKRKELEMSENAWWRRLERPT
jgi:hypothetical protein